MSIIVKSGSDICKAITNTSTAKYQYTIPKAARFPESKRPQAVAKYVLLPSTLSKRFTKFGYGNKSDFTKSDKNNQAKFNDPQSDFNQKNPHGPKYSFPSGREKYGKVYLESSKPYDKDIPGPEKYYYLKPFGYDAPKISFKEWTKTESKKKDIDEDKEQPKPYNTNVTIQIRPSGKYPVSQIPNVNSMKFDKDKSKRTDFGAKRTPGPGDYEMKQLLGRVFPSKYKSYEPITIAGRHIIKDSRSNYPGPGSYPLPSDFGQYRSKDYEKYPKENVYTEKKREFEEKAWRHGMKKIVPKKEKEEEYNDVNNEEENEEKRRQEEEEEQKRKEEEEQRQKEEEQQRQKEEEQQKQKEEEEKKKKEEEEQKKKEEEEKEQKENELKLLREILVY
jgi:chemotaxis protein histidine kinase CheA